MHRKITEAHLLLIITFCHVYGLSVADAVDTFP